MNYDYKEEELMSMVCETNEDVRNKLYETYEPTIKYFVKKYIPIATKLGVDIKDLYQEAMVGFADAINSYDEKKDAGLRTFVNLCIERRLSKTIEKAKRPKFQITRDTLSLEYQNNKGQELRELISDIKADPLEKFSEQEKITNIEQKIKKELSTQEYIVYDYLKNEMSYQNIAKVLDKSPKQIDNTIQRVKNKIKSIIEKEELL